MIRTDWVVLRPAVVHGFPCHCGHFRPPSPDTFVSGSSSLERYPSSPEQFRSTNRPLSRNRPVPCDTKRPRRERLPGGSGSPSSRHQPATSTDGPELPRSNLDGPSAAFRTLSTACSATGLAGLFHPAATSRVSLQGVVPHLGAAPTFAGQLPSARSSAPRYGCPCHAKRPRIQGFSLQDECGGCRNR